MQPNVVSQALLREQRGARQSASWHAGVPAAPKDCAQPQTQLIPFGVRSAFHEAAPGLARGFVARTFRTLPVAMRPADDQGGPLQGAAPVTTHIVAISF